MQQEQEVDLDQIREAARRWKEKQRQTEQEKGIRKAQETMCVWVEQFKHRAR